jgi:hypothetical protein
MRGKGFAKGVERAGTDVAEDDANGTDDQRRARSMAMAMSMRVRGIFGCFAGGFGVSGYSVIHRVSLS